MNNSLREGFILDSGVVKYKIISILGQGGFGITYLVIGELKVGNVTTEAKFAIKEHFPSVFCSRENAEVIPIPNKQQEFEHSKSDFIAEAKKLHALGTQNDNIVKVNEVFEANGTAYYVMQYINGESLSTYVKNKGKLSYKEAISILSPIFDAVDFLHKSRINHLDIKPDNIMLHDGMAGITPVLIDFGLSIHFKKNGEKTSPKGVQGVSEGYSPLEQYAGIKEFIPATDIYALMATLIFCVTGTTPKSAAELRMSEVRSILDSKVPQDSIEGICKGLNKSFDDRTSSISILKSDLGISSSGTGTITKIINIEEEKKKRNRIILIIVAVIFSLILIYVLLPKRNSTSVNKNLEQDSIPEISNVDTEEAKEIMLNRDSVNINTPAVPIVKPVEPKSNPVISEPPKPVVSSGTLSLGYGIWTGGIKDGKPDGKGKILFNFTHQIDRSTNYEANPGDYFIGNYDYGRLISGKLYDSSGNLLKTIIP